MKKLILAIAIFLGASPLWAELMTYQGRLKEFDIPVSANRVMLFQFCNAETGGTCSDTPSGAQSFAVQNGLFKATFTVPTADLAQGEWFLQVSVGLDVPGLQLLTPRERLTAVPYSVFASSAGYAAGAVNKTGDTMSGQLTVSGSTFTVIGPDGNANGGLMWVSTSAVTPALFVSTTGRVGVGTSAPGRSLHIVNNSGQVALLVEGRDATATSIYVDSKSNGKPAYGYLKSGILRAMTSVNPSYSFQIETDSTPRLTITQAGLTGIGAVAPDYQLHVSSGAGEAGTIMAVSTGTSNLFWVAGDGAHATRFYGDGSGLSGVTGATDGTKVLKAGDTMTGPLHILSDDLLNDTSDFITTGIVISTGGAIQTTGLGHGTAVGNPRGLGAVDLQTYRALSVQVASGNYSVLSGGFLNRAVGAYSAVGGGYTNSANTGYATVGGGLGNTASGLYSGVGGGQNNTASGQDSFVTGGNGNTAGDTASAVGGGQNNIASGVYSAVGGGRENMAAGQYASVPGGYNNTAEGNYSFAAGAMSSSTAQGAFTWQDSGGATIKLVNGVTDRTVFKNRGGFLVTGSTNTAMSGTLDRGVIMTGNGLLGVAINAPQAALDVVSTGTASTVYSQIWRDSDGVTRASVTATGVFYGDGSGLTNISAANAVLKTGDTMQGTLDMNGNNLAGVSTITLNSGSLAIVPAGTGGSNAIYGISIGSNTYNNYSNGLGLGHSAHNNYLGGVGVGNTAFENYNYGVGVGDGATTNFGFGVGVGKGASGNSNYGVGIGASAAGNKNYAAALGAYSFAATSATALGSYARANARDSVAIGAWTVNDTTGTASFGSYPVEAPAYWIAGSTVIRHGSGIGTLAIGHNAGRLDGGAYNLFVGSAAGNSHLSGSNNVMLGYGAGFQNTNGAANTFIGSAAGNTNTTGDSNIVIGFGQQTSDSAAASELNIGGVIFGQLGFKTIGISTRVPQAALDIVSTGTLNTQMAQIWRNSNGLIVGSMSVTGSLQAVRFVGDGSGITGVTGASGTDASKLPLTGGILTGNLLVQNSTLSVSGGGISVSSSGAADLGLYVDIGGGHVRTQGSHPLYLGSQGTDIMVVDVTGNVGIDKNGPLYRLDVNGAGAFSGQTIVGGTLTVQGSDFSVGGSTFVVKGGSVGIGTTSPNSPLEVWTDGQYVFTGGAPSSNAVVNLIPQSGGTAMINNNANGPVALAVGHTSHLLVDEFGNVGLSSTTPSYRLVVSSGAGEAGTIMAVSTGTSNLFWVAGDGAHAVRFFGDGSGLTNVTAAGAVQKTGDTMDGTLYIDGSSGSDALLSITHANNGSLITAGLTSGATAVLYADTDSVGLFSEQAAHRVGIGAGNTEALTVTQNRVGVSTTSPYYTLDVNGPGRFAGQVIAGGSVTVAGSAFSVGASTFVVDAGRVGINWPNPEAALQVSGGAKFLSSAGTSYILTAGSAARPDMFFVSSGGVVGAGDFNGISVDTAAVVSVAPVLKAAADGAVGLNVYARTDNTAAVTATGPDQVLAGGNFEAAAGGDDSVTLLAALRAQVRREAAGAGGGVVSKAYGLIVDDIYTDSGAGVITDTYGIYIGSQSSVFGGMQTNLPYAIYSQDPGARTYLAGNLGLGATTPEARLDVMSIGADPATMGQIWRSSLGTIVSSMSATGVMMASRFVGDGGGLTNIPGLQKTGDTMTGPLTMAGSSITIRNSDSNEGLFIYRPDGFFMPGLSLCKTAASCWSIGGGGSNDSLAFQYNAGNRFILTPDGNLTLNAASQSVSRLQVTPGSGDAYSLYISSADGTTPALTVRPGGALYTAGRVGIGSLAPAEALDISGRLMLSTRALSNDDTDGLISFGNGGVAYQSGGNTYMRVANGGNYIGIGPSANVQANTNSPRLQVKGSMSVGSTYNTSQPPANSLVVEGRLGAGTSAPDAALSVVQSDVAGSSYTVHIGTSASAYHLVVTTGGWVGLNTRQPHAPLHLTAATKDEGIVVEHNSSTSEGSFLALLKARGTATSQTLVADGDNLGVLAFGGYNNAPGDPFPTAAAIVGRVDGTPTVSAPDMPGRLEFMTAADGTADMIVRMVIKNDGGVGISTGNPQAMLDILSTATVAQVWRDAGGVIRASMTASGQFYANIPGLGDKVSKGGDFMYGPLSIAVSDPDIDAFDLTTTGLNISTSGALQTQGFGHGAASPGARGLGAVDLQTARATNSQVARGDFSTLSGGAYNTILGSTSVVAGGLYNTVAGTSAVISGGEGNSAGSYFSTVGGGKSNAANGTHSAVAGGWWNVANSAESFIGGGGYNTADGSYGVIAGGYENKMDSGADMAFIGGGKMNRVTPFGLYSAVVGGSSNTVAGEGSFIGGGAPNGIGKPGNKVYSNFASIVGGSSNTIDSSAYWGFIGGGVNNQVSGESSVVAGGDSNLASGFTSVVAGGSQNKATADSTFVGGGASNIGSGTFAIVPGGRENTAKGSYSFAAGYRSSSTAAGTFTWADSQGVEVLNNVTNQVRFKAAGGFMVSTSTVYSTPGLFVNQFNTVGIGTATASSDVTLFVNRGSGQNKFLLGTETRGLSLRDTGSLLDIEGIGSDIIFNANGKNAYFYQGKVGFGTTGGGVADTKVAIVHPFTADDPYVLKVGTGTNPVSFTVSTSGVIGMPMQSMARAFASASHATTHNVWTVVQIDSKLEDTQDEFDTVNYRFTTKSGGLYLVAGHVWFPANATGSRGIGISLNGTPTPEKQSTDVRGTGPSSSDLTVSSVMRLAPGSSVQLMAFQSSTVALNVGNATLDVVKLN